MEKKLIKASPNMPRLSIGFVAKLKNMKPRAKRTLIAIGLAVLIIAVFIAVEAYLCAHRFEITEYSFNTASVSSAIRIVMLSDLHESEFGKANSKLIEAVKREKPDVIVCAGDMISYNADDSDLRIGLDLIEQLCKIAPVYMSLGNHETRYIDLHGDELLRLFADAGANVLEKEYVDVEINGDTIRVGGISDYCFNYGEADYKGTEKYRFLTEFCNTDNYKLLLCHRPHAYKLKSEADAYEDWDCDIVLAGHTHGGLWQLPAIGSVYLPSQGFFPEYDKGLFDMGNAQMLVGGGLGHNAILFRLFNPCELVVVDIIPAQR